VKRGLFGRARPAAKAAARHIGNELHVPARRNLSRPSISVFLGRKSRLLLLMWDRSVLVGFVRSRSKEDAPGSAPGLWEKRSDLKGISNHTTYPAALNLASEFQTIS